MKKFSLIAFILCLNLLGSSQQATCVLSGSLIDAVSGTPLCDVTITSGGFANHSNDTPRTTTDANGFFVMEVSEIPDSLHLDLIGYEKFVSVPPNCCDRFLVYAAHAVKSQLQEVNVQGFQNATSREKIPASIGFLDRKVLDATDQSSFQNAVNTIPGVIMESRGYGGSHKLSIRGSALRSPFAVRNLKMYLEGIPLTSPDGQAPLEMLDPSDISSLEIIKGPAGSVWGSGNGGVILFKSRKAVSGENRIGFTSQVGSFGASRSSRYIEVGFEKGSLRISQINQDLDGYRQQEFNHKRQLSIALTKYLDDKNKLFVYGTYYKGNWGLPGALTLTQNQNNPRQAVVFSLQNHAELQRKRLMAGISHTHKFSQRFSETTSGYAYSTQKDNPYGTSAFNSGYKDEGSDGFGGRTDWNFLWIDNQNLSCKINFGGEWQSEKYNILENKIALGEPGDFKYHYDIGYLTSMGFVSADVKYNNRFILNVGTSINRTIQDVQGFTADGFAFDTTATWKSTFLPRLALSARLIDELFVFGSIGAGNANPTAFEMVDYENNGFNLSLQPERGLNTEFGVKELLAKWNFQFEVSVYQFNLKNAILAYVDTSVAGDDRVRYHNRGNTYQQGVEWSVSKKIRFGKTAAYAEITHSGSIYHYVYGDYILNDKNFESKRIPGIPLSMNSNSLMLHPFEGFDFTAFHYWFDKAPLDNSNEIWSNAYHLVNIQAAYSRTFFEQLTMGVYGGVNNVFNAHYSSNYSLNAVGGKYFNPSPLSNYFAGIRLSWKI